MSKRVCTIITLASLLALVVTACGTLAPPPPLEETPAPGETPAPTTPPAPTEPPEPLVATFIQWQAFIDLAPAYTYGSENPVTNQCYENLIWMNPPGSDQMLRPGLATRWESNEDATEWTFYLREGVTFQDGTAFTADDVKATIDYYLAQEGAGCSWIWLVVEEVEVVDDYTVKVYLSYTAALDLIVTANYCGYMVSEDALDQPKEWFDAGQCVGTGPYTIESFEKGQRLVMTRFDDYWGGWPEGENQFDKIVYEIVHDQAVATQMIEQGDADVYPRAPVDKLDGLDAREDLVAYISPSLQHMMFHPNTQRPPFDNKLVRQALSYSFPYDQLEERSAGAFTQSRGALPQAYWGWCEDCFQYTYDLDKARELLEEAGYPDGGFEIWLTYAAGVPEEEWAVELWTFPLSELGIELRAEVMEFAVLWELAKSDPATAQDMTTFIWWPAYVDPYDPLFTLYHSEDEPYWNVGYWYNSEYDALIDEGHELTASDREAAAELFIEAQHILVDEAAAIFLADIPNTYVLRSDIDGFVDNPAYPGVVFFYELTTTR